jgi:hypothetical protein
LHAWKAIMKVASDARLIAEPRCGCETVVMRYP